MQFSNIFSLILNDSIPLLHHSNLELYKTNDSDLFILFFTDSFFKKNHERNLRNTIIN